jgi:hypothetical protein
VIVELLIVCATVLAIAIVLSERSDALRMLRGHRVTIHTQRPDDQTLHGLLVLERPDRLVLADAVYVTEQGEHPIPGGRAVIYKRTVSWLQDHVDTEREVS